MKCFMFDPELLVAACFAPSLEPDFVALLTAFFAAFEPIFLAIAEPILAIKPRNLPCTWSVPAVSVEETLSVFGIGIAPVRHASNSTHAKKLTR